MHFSTSINVKTIFYSSFLKVIKNKETTIHNIKRTSKKKILLLLNLDKFYYKFTYKRLNMCYKVLLAFNGTIYSLLKIRCINLIDVSYTSKLYSENKF